MHHQMKGPGERNGLSEGIGIGGVRDDEAGTDRLGGGPQRGLPPRGQDDVVADFGEPATAGHADTAAATGDQCGSHDRPSWSTNPQAGPETEIGVAK